jgi:hypothetical protein
MGTPALSRGAKIGILIGVLGTLVGLATAVSLVALFAWPSRPREPLRVRLDPAGPYLILASRRAGEHYAAAIGRARELHPEARQAAFDPADLDGARTLLREQQPRYALVFLEPDELDVNFAWRWLTLTTELDDDPFVDVRTGFITGATPEAAAAFVDRIAAAVRGELELPGAFVDDLGPNTQAGPRAFYDNPGSFFIPALGGRLTARSISHGAEAIDDRRLASLQGVGLLHLGGHGHPDRVDDGVTGAQIRRAPLAPCVVFSGACYTGVTGPWYDPFGPSGKVEARAVEPADSFCLNLLQNRAVAYLAALHVDHGMPVYQEMEYLASRGGSLGDVIKSTHDGVILGSGGRVPRFEAFAAGSPAPHWTNSETMLRGTASRVLFGDPALIVTDSFTGPPFRVSVEEDGDGLRLTATLDNTLLQSSYTDTYHADLAQNPDQFNDRALISAELPPGWTGVGKVEVIEVTAAGRPLQHRLGGYAVESDAGRRVLHAQVDVPATGFMQSAFRVAGATVRLRASR